MKEPDTNERGPGDGREVLPVPGTPEEEKLNVNDRHTLMNDGNERGVERVEGTDPDFCPDEVDLWKPFGFGPIDEELNGMSFDGVRRRGDGNGRGYFVGLCDADGLEMAGRIGGDDLGPLGERWGAWSEHYGIPRRNGRGRAIARQNGI